MASRRERAGQLERHYAEDVAARWHIPVAIAKGVIADVIDSVIGDLERAAEALGRGDPDLRLAARVIALRLGYAKDRVVGDARRAPTTYGPQCVSSSAQKAPPHCGHLSGSQ